MGEHYLRPEERAPKDSPDVVALTDHLRARFRALSPEKQRVYTWHLFEQAAQVWASGRASLVVSYEQLCGLMKTVEDA